MATRLRKVRRAAENEVTPPLKSDIELKSSGSPDKVPGKYDKKSPTERVMDANRIAKVVGGSSNEKNSGIKYINEVQNQNAMAKKISKDGVGKGMRVLKDGVFPKPYNYKAK